MMTDSRAESARASRSWQPPSFESLEERVLLSGVELSVLGTYATGVFDEGAAEIAAHDPVSQRVFVTNGDAGTIDILDVANPTNPTLFAQIDVADDFRGWKFDVAPTHVAVNNETVAVAVNIEKPTKNNGNKPKRGAIGFYGTDGTYLGMAKAGYLPDMVLFTPDGQTVLAANEGEPDDHYKRDPDGSVTIVDVSGGIERRMRSDEVKFKDFNGDEAALEAAGVRLGPSKKVSQNLEPEYIAVSSDSATAYVTLQENNALAVLDIASETFTDIFPFGLKDHSVAGNGLDPSNKDAGIAIATHPVYGMYQPDAIASYEVGGKTYVVTANEGDARDYDGYSEEVRVADLTLDPTVFPNAADLQLEENLGRLKTTTQTGDIDGDGDFDEIHAYGARSFSIWEVNGALTQVYDSGDDFEQTIAALDAPHFNSTNDDNDSFDNRSDDKGPEPECVTLGEVGGRTYAFIGLERMGGIMVYDVTNPVAPTFTQYFNNRDFGVDADDPAAGDLGPEGLAFISAADSPNGMPILVVASEVSGTTTLYGMGELPAGDLTEYTAQDDVDDYFLQLISGKEPATDSASAATAMATGEKTDAGNISWESGDPAGGDLESIAETLRDDYGYAIGVASTVPYNHATPAAFASHNVSRNNYLEISDEMINEVKPDVVVGAGHPAWYKGGDFRYIDPMDYIKLAVGMSDYTFVGRRLNEDGGANLADTAAGLDVNAGDKLFGLFGGDGGMFEYHDVADAPGAPAVTQGSTENPLLADIVQATVDVLADDDDGFFAMFEQGDIDWTNHANDFENMIGGVWDLEQAVLAAEALVDGGYGGMDWSNTLMIVTSDHSNSYMKIAAELGQGDLPQQDGVPYAYTYPDGEVTYGTTNHTNELVTLSARGEGATLFGDFVDDWYGAGHDIVDNTNIYDVMMQSVADLGVENVMLFIGDGMNIAHEVAGSRYLYGDNQSLAWHDWGAMADGWAGFCTTWDIDTYNKYAAVSGEDPYEPGDVDPTVGYDPEQGGAFPLALDHYYLTQINGKEPATDSASAATAMATGEKTDAGNIAWERGDPVGGDLTTIAEEFDAEGLAIGVVSTVPFSHATPAAFVSHNVNRNNYQEIGNEIATAGLADVVIGGGNPNLYKGGGDFRYLAEADYNDLVAGATPYTDYVEWDGATDANTLLRNAAAGVDLNAGDKLFGYFGGEGGNFDYMVVDDAPGAPNVEQEVDPGAGVPSSPTLETITEEALALLNADPDGFFVMFEQGDIDWANHANDYENMVGGVWDLEQAVKAAEDFVESGVEGISWDNTLVIVTSDHSNSYLKLNPTMPLEEGNLPQQTGVPYAFDYPDGEVSYASTNHTNELVTLSARGAGADLFADYATHYDAADDIVDNTDIYEVMSDAVASGVAEHVILLIGDGMNLAHEVAGSRYLYSENFGLSWQSWDELGDGWEGFCTTWDVDTYDKYASHSGQAGFDAGGIDPRIGYDPVHGGLIPAVLG
jgi:alkaline phosphatase